MSKPRISIYLEVDTVAHGQIIKNNIQQQLVGKDLFDTISFDFGVGNDTAPNVIWGNAEFRFNNRVDRDDLKDWIKNQVQNHPQVKNWVLKARITSHLCSHDSDIVLDCTTTEFVIDLEK